MAIKDIQKSAKKTVTSAAKAVKKTEKKAAKKIRNTASSVRESVQSGAVTENIKNTFSKKEKESENINALKSCLISDMGSLKIYFYLMTADGKITDEEVDRFLYIGNAMIDNFDSCHEKMIAECSGFLKEVTETDDAYTAAERAISDVLAADMPDETSFTTPKLLIWNMITIACSDHNYSENEKKMIRSVAKKYDIGNDILLEMESSMLAAIDIEYELDWIKTTDRPYLEIERIVNELNERKNVIVAGVMALVNY